MALNRRQFLALSAALGGSIFAALVASKRLPLQAITSLIKKEKITMVGLPHEEKYSQEMLRGLKNGEKWGCA
ncbi:TPA: twin-arginine translocation signal domain-containing protein [Candidatus Micrarchaeota archaeon]|nr:twin-arginine translocation signal domain-containing protein [Candidatus Micrarchaeota archaeon]